MKRSSFALGLVLAASTALSCAGGSGHTRAFSTNWIDDQGASIAQVQGRLRGARPPADTNVVVAVAGKHDEMLGLPLGGGAPWSFKHALDTRPIVAGPVVVGSGHGEVFAVDAATGNKLWARPTGGVPVVGAGDDGALTALTLARTGGSTLLVVARDGSVRAQIETDKALGEPAVVGGIVFVPWANQYVSAIDPATGEEIGRVTLRDKVSRAVAIGGTLYFGELAFVRFDDRITQASRGGASRVGVPTRELPGTPRLLGPGTEPLPPVANARDRDRLFARPSGAEGPLTLDSGRYYATYFRLAFGLDAKDGKLAWVHTHPVDLIGGTALWGGVLVCDQTGRVSALDAKTGAVTFEQTFGRPIASCVARADTFRAPPAPGGAPPLVQQISEALSTHEATLATAHRLLLRELGAMQDEGATKTLIDLASDPRTPPVLLADARAALATRRNGATYMIAALGRHYDFLKDVLASPPVGPMADALAAMKETRAAPLLASHLLDPADNDDDMRRAGAALAVLATAAEKKPLEQFFTMYRGTAPNDDVAFAVGSIGEALLRIDPKDGRALVEAASKDPMTVELARNRLQALLAASPAPAAEKAPAENPAEKAPAEKAPAEKKPAPKPAKK